MASVHHYLNETHVAWQPFSSSDVEHVAVTEIWKTNEKIPNATTSVHRKVSKPELSSWLQHTDGTNSHTESAVERNCVLRVVWVHFDKKQRIVDVNAVFFEQLCAAFRHQSAQTYCRTQYAGIGSINDQDTGKSVNFLCNHSKFVFTWSHDAETGVTSVICVAERRKLDVLQDMTENEFIQKLAHHEMTPALMSALMTSKEIDLDAREIKKQVQGVEERTGYHEWTVHPEESAKGDLVGLSARMSGCGSRIEGDIRRSGVVTEFNRFIRNYLEDEKNHGSKKELSALNEVIEIRTAMQVLELKYILSRIRTQKEALFNLISANDSTSAQHIAEQSRLLSHATRSDAQSMKLLALVTTIFLPGTFVSGLFSTPMFQRESRDKVDDTIVKVWKPGLFLYIAVSMPLLVVTLLFWGLWTFGYKLKDEKNDRVARKHLFHNAGFTEKESLIARQSISL
ncbi:unnamed protein product [Alternaria sp. RS040]